jgi:NAD(P)-dependent dehydrogenase (short-subunit alcohol dehydrogenase family)
MSRVWLVTGAGSGFGRAITQAAVSAGDTVLAAGRHAASLDDLVAAHPGQVEAIQLDVTDAAAIEAAVADVLARHGRIDVLVNNAGRTHVGAAEETTDAELRSLFEVHLFGPAALVRAVLPQMRARRSGAIVQLSSMGGQMSFAGFSAYSATKFALEGFSEGLADEVGPLGIKVLIVEPGAFRTGLFSAASASAESDTYAATVGATRAMIAAGNGQQPGDPAKAAAAILTALNAEHTPLRLPLGDDGVDAVLGHLDAVRGEIAAWEKVARDTAFDDLYGSFPDHDSPGNRDRPAVPAPVRGTGGRGRRGGRLPVWLSARCRRRDGPGRGPQP